MAKVVFIQQTLFEYLGPMALSAFLKKHGHDVDMLVEDSEPNLIDTICRLKPDVLAFSCQTGSHVWTKNIAYQVKKKIDTISIFGGAHPTFFPEFINEETVDIICRGEGEHALLELVDSLDKNRNINNILNLWVKEGNILHKNDVRPLIENLDSLPFPDRRLYDKYVFLRDITTKKFMTGRGCPYNCAFCFNHALRKLYEGKGKYVRKRSVANMISELAEIKSNYDLKTVRFSDDTFTTHHTWLFEFADRYKKDIDLPYTCLIRANEVKEEVIKCLRDSGCFLVTFGVESGNEDIRNGILKKNISNEDIIRTGRLLKKYGILFGTSNMLGLPTETIDNMFETLNINIEAGVDLPTCAIFQPYPKTEILEYLKAMKLVEERADTSTMYADIFNRWDIDVSVLKSNHKNKMFNLHKFFFFYIRFPFLRPLIRLLIKLPPNPVFSLIYRLGWAYRIKESLRLSWLASFTYAIKIVRNWLVKSKS